MSYLVLFLTILLLWMVVYPITNHSLFAPPSLILLMFAFGTGLAVLGELYWNDVELSLEAYLVVVVGCLGVVLAAIIAKRIFRYTYPPKTIELGQITIEKIANIADSRWGILAVFVVGGALFNIVEMVLLAQAAGVYSSNIMEIAQWARGNTSTLLTSGNDETESYSAVSSGLTKLIVFCGYAAVIGLAAKIKCKIKKRRSYYAVSILLLLTCAFSLLKGGRDTVAHYVVAFLIVLFAFYVFDSKNRNKTSFDFAKIGLVTIVIALPLFYFALELVGRTRSVPLFDYVSFYLGGGIPSLSYILDNPTLAPIDSIPGERTFTQFYALLDKIGIIGGINEYAGNYVRVGNHSSNIFTCFYRYYVDFGYIGVFILSGLSTLVFCACFQALEKNPSISIKIFALYICSYTVDVIREEFIFSRLLSASLLWAIIASLAIGWVLTYDRYRLKSDEISAQDASACN